MSTPIKSSPSTIVKVYDFLTKKGFITFIVLLCISCIVFFSLIFILNTGELHLGNIKPDVWGQYGDLIGGFVGTIVALVASLLLIRTLKEQRYIHSKEQIESRFFELLKVHLDNVQELSSKTKKGRSVIVWKIRRN
jgi:hypothetical protein